MNPQAIAVVVVALTLGALALLLLLYGRPRRTAQEPMPANFSRGDPDSVLETSRLQKAQVWGFAGALFITGFLAVYFVIEPFRQASYAERFHEASVERGEEIYLEEAQCNACHGAEGVGGFASSDPTWPAPPLNNVFYRYTAEEIEQIIAQGRPHTPMPAWAVEFGGPLNDQKIDDVVNYLLEIQVPDGEQFELPQDMTDGRQIFEQKCAVCHGDDARGRPMGQPLPTYWAADLTTEFYRLGLQVKRSELKNQLRAQLGQEPSDQQIEDAMAKVAPPDVIEAGREAARQTIEDGRRPTPMPQWQNRIYPEQIDAVLAYLASIQRVPS